MLQFIKTTSNEIIDLGNSDISVSDLKKIVLDNRLNNNINEIHITRSMLGDEGATYVADLIKINKDLKSVHLRSSHDFLSGIDQRITDVGMGYLASSLVDNKNVELLDLTANKIGDMGAGHIKLMLPLSGLKALNIERNGLTTAGVRTISEALGLNPILEWLSIAGNDAMARGAEHLSNAFFEINKETNALIQKNSHLKHLDISYNSLCAFSMKYIAQILACNQTLETLRLQGNVIKVTGLSKIVTAITENKESALICIDLSQNYIGLHDPHVSLQMAALIANLIKKNATLKVINLAVNCVTWDAASLIADDISLNQQLEVLYLGISHPIIEKCLMSNVRRKRGLPPLIMNQTSTGVPVINSSVQNKQPSQVEVSANPKNRKIILLRV